MNNSRILQGNYYSVLYDGESKTKIMETKQELKPGNRYQMNGKVFTVKNKKNFKLTLEDIDNIRVATEGYEEGVGRDIFQHMKKAWDRKIPNVHFSPEEKDFLSYIYYENEYCNKDIKDTLAKVLEIKDEIVKEHDVPKFCIKRKAR